MLINKYSDTLVPSVFVSFDQRSGPNDFVKPACAVRNEDSLTIWYAHAQLFRKWFIKGIIFKRKITRKVVINIVKQCISNNLTWRFVCYSVHYFSYEALMAEEQGSPWNSFCCCCCSPEGTTWILPVYLFFFFYFTSVQPSHCNFVQKDKTPCCAVQLNDANRLVSSWRVPKSEMKTRARGTLM